MSIRHFMTLSPTTVTDNEGQWDIESRRSGVGRPAFADGQPGRRPSEHPNGSTRRAIWQSLRQHTHASAQSIHVRHPRLIARFLPKPVSPISRSKTSRSRPLTLRAVFPTLTIMRGADHRSDCGIIGIGRGHVRVPLGRRILLRRRRKSRDTGDPRSPLLLNTCVRLTSCLRCHLGRLTSPFIGKAWSGVATAHR